MTQAYRVDHVLYLLHTDPAFLAAFRTDRATALSATDCSDEEASELKRGDIAALYVRGAHPFLLHGFVRHALGVDQSSYMKQVCAADRAARARKAGAS